MPLSGDEGLIREAGSDFIAEGSTGRKGAVRPGGRGVVSMGSKGLWYV